MKVNSNEKSQLIIVSDKYSFYSAIRNFERSRSKSQIYPRDWFTTPVNGKGLPNSILWDFISSFLEIKSK